jgi:hypothetical protein
VLKRLAVQYLHHISSYPPRILLFATVLVTFIANAGADTLTLKDGDTYSGVLVGAKTGILSFRTQLVGKIAVPIDEVFGASTQNFVVVALKDGTRLPGRLRSREGSIFVVGQGGKDSWLKVNLAQVQTITTMAASASEDAAPLLRPPAEIDTQGSASIGYIWRSGQESFSGPVVEIELGAVGDLGSLTGSIQAEYVGDEAKLDRFAEAEIRVQAASQRRWSPEFELEIERNRNKALKLRTDFTAAIAASLIQDDEQSLELRIGLGVAYEEFDPEPLRRDEGRIVTQRPGESPQHDTDLNLDLRLQYRRDLYRGAYIEKILSIRPSLTDLGEIRSRWESNLYIPVSKKMMLNFKVLLDHESDLPYRDIDELQTGVQAGFKVNF